MIRRKLSIMALIMMSMPSGLTPIDLGRTHEKPTSKGHRGDKRDWKNNLLRAREVTRRNSVKRGK